MIRPGTVSEKAETSRRILQEAIDSMPAKAAKLIVTDKGLGKGTTREKGKKKK